MKLTPLYAAASAAVLSSGYPLPAPASERMLEEVVVTARKRTELLQDVPISITVKSGDEMLRDRIIGFDDVGLANPNVAMGNETINATPVIRGNTQSDPSTQLDMASGLYLDGMIISRSMGFNGSFYDFSSMQTLKGPQGTLFGRNTTGGAMLFTTTDPSFDAVGGYVDVEGGSEDTWGVEGAVDIPLGDSLALRLSGRHRESGDYLHYNDGSSLGAVEWDGARAKLLWHVTDLTSLTFLYDFARQDGSGAVQKAEQGNNPRLSGPNVGGNVLNLFTGQFVDTPHTTTDERGYGENHTYLLTATHEWNDSEVKFIAGYREVDVEFNISLPPGTGYSQQDKPGLENTTLELQYNSAWLDDRLQLTSGLYWFDETTHEDQDTYLFEELSGQRLSYARADTDIQSWSAYAQASYALTDRFGLTLGGRYTDDARETTGDQYRFGEGESGPQELEYEETEFNYLVALDYKPGESVMLYASTATGYRSGGANLIADTDNPGHWEPFAPESVTNYEAGIKSDWLDGSLRLNGAFFYQDYEDYQYNNIEAVGGIPTRVANSTDAVIEGGELELSYLSGFGLLVSLSYGLTDSEIQEGPYKGDQMPTIPKNNYSLALDYSIEIGPGELALRAVYDYMDEFWSYTAFPDESRVDDRELVNLTATYSWASWRLIGYVDNALDEVDYMSVVFSDSLAGTNGTFGIQQTTLTRPRVVGMKLRYDF